MMKFENIKNNLDDLVSYHISPYKFDKPSYQEILDLRDSDKRNTHVNSYLGLWSSTYPQSYKSESKSNCYEIKFKKNTNIKFINHSDFRRWCNTPEKSYYINQRNMLIAENIDVIIVLDRLSGMKCTLAEIITLNFNAIESFKHITDNRKDLPYVVEIEDGFNYT